MKYRATQPNFSRGELAPQLYGRFDVDTWQSSLRLARNVLILKYGGVTKRPGTRLVGEVLDASSDNRLIPFQFSLTQTYALEMGQGYMAPCAFGGRVLETDLAITGITATPNAQITAAFHGYLVGNYVWITGIAGDLGDLLNNRKWQVVTVVDANNFTINADTTGLAAFTTADGGETRVVAPDPDPTAPTVPAPVTEPTDPYVGGGGGGGFCVTDDTFILMAGGDQVPASDLRIGDILRTQHEHTMEWGAYPVEAISFADEPVFACSIGDVVIRATAEHRFWIGGEWVHAKDIGEAGGTARVAKITVQDAHTYISAGVLSHNVKPIGVE